MIMTSLPLSHVSWEGLIKWSMYSLTTSSSVVSLCIVPSVQHPTLHSPFSSSTLPSLLQSPVHHPLLVTCLILSDGHLVSERPWRHLSPTCNAIPQSEYTQAPLPLHKGVKLNFLTTRTPADFFLRYLLISGWFRPGSVALGDLSLTTLLLCTYAGSLNTLNQLHSVHTHFHWASFLPSHFSVLCVCKHKSPSDIHHVFVH